MGVIWTGRWKYGLDLKFSFNCTVMTWQPFRLQEALCKPLIGGVSFDELAIVTLQEIVQYFLSLIANHSFLNEFSPLLFLTV